MNNQTTTKTLLEAQGFPGYSVSNGFKLKLKGMLSKLSTGNSSGRKKVADTVVLQDSSGPLAPVRFGAEPNEIFSPLEKSFEELNKITEGGQGDIFSAVDRALKRQVAIKSLKSSQLASKSTRKLFLEEAKLTAQLDHPGIIPVYSLNQDKHHCPSFSMKYVNGLTLKDYLDDIVEVYETDGLGSYDEPISLVHRLECFLKICAAIEYSHAKRVVHQDLKPENIMIGEFHEVYVMDWGIAAMIGTPNLISKENPDCLVGTPGYIDPACIHDKLPNTQSDIYALGILLFEMITLKTGFVGETAQAVVHSMLAGIQPPIKHRFDNNPIHPDLVAIIQKARCPSRENRYQTVVELADDIRLFLGDEEVASNPDDSVRKALRFVRHNLFKTVAFSLTIMLILAGISISCLYSQIQIIQRADAREAVLTQYQATVSRRAHSLDTHFLHLTHLLNRMGERISWTLEKKTLGESKIYNASDYAGDSPPPGTVYSEASRKNLNLNYPVYTLSPGVELREVEDEIRSIFSLRKDFLETQLQSSFEYLSGNIPMLKQKLLRHGVPITWIYAGFERGYFIAFPGKSGYPADFDARKRPWYIAGKNHQGTKWGAPYFDINGLGLVLPCTFPLLDKEHVFRGVASVDISLEYLFSKLISRQGFGQDNVVEKVVLDSQGQVLASTGQENLDEKNAKLDKGALQLQAYHDQDVMETVLRKKRGQYIKESDGKEYIYAFSAIPSLNWYYLEKIEFQVTKAEAEVAKIAAIR